MLQHLRLPVAEGVSACLAAKGFDIALANHCTLTSADLVPPAEINMQNPILEQTASTSMDLHN
jgi:hypothetical protein